MFYEFPDRRDRLLGRDADIAALEERAGFKGVTAVVGPPQTGKSWLLAEVARRLSATCQVGYTPAHGGPADLLQRAARDLYVRWLSQPDWKRQAGLAWEQRKDDLLYGMDREAWSLFSDLLEDAGPDGPADTLADQLMNDLLDTGLALAWGIKRITAPVRLVRYLMDVAASLTNRPAVLFLDPWDETLDPNAEAKAWSAVLGLEDWIGCHIFLALRPDSPVVGVVEDLARDNPGVATIHRLTDMDLAARDAQDYRYGDLEDRLRQLSQDGLALAARLVLVPQAPSDPLWPEIKATILEGLPPEGIDDLVQNGILESPDPPSFGHPTRWDATREWLAGNRAETLRREFKNLVRLFRFPVQEADSRHYPLCATLAGMAPIGKRLEIEPVFLAVCQGAASLLRAPVNADAILIAGARAAAREETPPPGATLISMGLVNALHDATWDKDPRRRDALLDEIRDLARAHPDDATLRDPLAMGLQATVCHVHNEDEYDMPRRDALLDELRDLARAHPGDTTVREHLIWGIRRSLSEGEADGDLPLRDALLDELRDLARAHPGETRLRWTLAGALLETLEHADEDHDLPRCVALLDELRDLARAHPGDVRLRDALADALVDTIENPPTEDDHPRTDAMLDEIRDLALAHPGDANLRERLANGLFEALEHVTKKDGLSPLGAIRIELGFPSGYAAVPEPQNRGAVDTVSHTKDEGDLPRRDALLDELRGLALPHSDDASALHSLFESFFIDFIAESLFITLTEAREEKDLSHRDALLDELCDLARAYPEDGSALEWVAKGLLNTLVAIREEDDSARRDALVGALNDLAGAYSDRFAILERVTRGLFDTLTYAREMGEVQRRDALLDEFREFARACPEDAIVLVRLAGALYDTLDAAKEEDDRPRRDALLDELRELARACPEVDGVRERLAMGLYHTLDAAKKEGDLARRDALLDELREFARAYPEDSDVLRALAKGLYNTLDTSGEEEEDAGDPRRCDTLLGELRALAEAKPGDVPIGYQLARGLYKTLNDADYRRDRRRRDALLDEMRGIARAYSWSVDLHAWLAKGLYNTSVAANREHDLGRRDALLDEIRDIARVRSHNDDIREVVAKGLFNAFTYAYEENEPARGAALLDELRALAEANPEDAAVQGQLAMGLFNRLVQAEEAADTACHDALLDELRGLYRQSCREAGIAPDEEALGPIVEKLVAMGVVPPPSEDDG